MILIQGYLKIYKVKKNIKIIRVEEEKRKLLRKNLNEMKKKFIISIFFLSKFFLDKFYIREMQKLLYIEKNEY